MTLITRQHSYIANGLGGSDGVLVIDLRNMTALTLDSSTGIAVIDAGKRLGNVALELNAGGRGMGHGTCSYVGEFAPHKSDIARISSY